MADIAHVRDGFVGFANERILPHLPQNKQFLAGMMIGLASSRADSLYNSLADNQAVKMLGLIGQDGSIDIQSLYGAAKDQIRKTGSVPLDVPMLGTLTFSEADIDALYQHIQMGG